MQTIHGSKLVADRALRDTADSPRMVRALEQLSTWLGDAALEGRAALESLRPPSGEHGDLADAFRRAIDECQAASPAEISFSVGGDPRQLRSGVRDEAYRIGYEAIRNACTHAAARHIAIRLEHGDVLTLSVRDDGVGMDVAHSARSGRSGLHAMRERAARIDATLVVASRPGAGTTITLEVPARTGVEQLR